MENNNLLYIDQINDVDRQVEEDHEMKVSWVRAWL